MQQHSLLDDPKAEPLSLVAIVGHRRTLTPAQRKFNQLIEQINSKRRELADWREFQQVFQQQLADRYHPARARLRNARIAMAVLLDVTLDGKALDRRERAKTQDILIQLLSQLLEETQEPELVGLYDKHAQRSFDDEQQQQLDAVRALASEEFGVASDAIPGGGSADELAQWIDAQFLARSGEPEPARPRRKSAKAIARETAREQTAQGGTRALRELFRKLASELHPDRETDPAEQTRKTALMQRVNQAYRAGDLLALLELQLSIEQIDLADLAVLAEERLRHYVHVLEGQLQRLRDELTEFEAPFATAVRGIATGPLSPASVRRALQVETQQIDALARRVREDLVHFKDVRNFKRSLRDYRVGQLDSTDEATFEPPPRQPRRGNRRR